MIRNVEITDASSLEKIYNYYVEHSIATFEERVIPSKTMMMRIVRLRSDNYPFVVFVEDEKILGYAYVSEWNVRTAYRYTSEVSVYVDKDHTGKGIGEKMLREVVKQAKEQHVHSLIAVIAMPNDASCKMHQKLGFRQVGRLKEVGLKLKKLIDVEYWQIIL